MAKEKFRYTRFTRVYKSRKEAIRKLNNTSRYYGENVAISYKDDDKVNIILALYKSTSPGDYEINYESGWSGGSGSEEIVSVTRKEGESDIDALNRAIAKPGNGDIVVISGSQDTAYIYNNGGWLCLSKKLELDKIDSDTIKFNISEDPVLGIYTITGEVPIDETSLIVSETGKLQVGIIDGGNLRDLE